LDGRQQSSRSMGNKKKRRICRRLFQRLEQSIGSRRIAVVDAVDHRNPMTGSAPGMMEGVADFPNVFHPDDGIKPLPVLGPAPQYKKVRVRQRASLLCDPVLVFVSGGGQDSR